MKAAMVAACEPEVKPLGMSGDFEENMRFIAGLGYDGVELSVLNVAEIDTLKISQIVRRYNLIIPAVASGRYYIERGLSLSTGNNEVRKGTIASVKQSVRVVAELESNFVIGSAQGAGEGNRKESYKHLVESLGECAVVAEAQGVVLLLEPVNRYLQLTIRTIEEGLMLIKEVGSPAIRLLADTHHMNIEEKSNQASLRIAKGYLAHVHFSDSNRLAPGLGQIDFHAITRALRKIEYDGFVSAEIVPDPDQVTAAKQMIRLVKSLPY